MPKAWKFTVKNSAPTVLQDAVKQAFGARTIATMVACKSTNRPVKVFRGYNKEPGTKPDPRSARQNAQKLFINARKYGRDPIFFTASEVAEGVNIWEKGKNAFLRGGGLRALKAAGQKIADYMVARVKKHIIEGRSKNGPMPSLDNSKNGYAAQKDKMYDNLPILIKSGGLFESLYGKVKPTSRL